MAIRFFKIWNKNSGLFVTAGDVNRFDQPLRQENAAEGMQQQWTLTDGFDYFSFTDPGVIAAQDAAAAKVTKFVCRAKGWVVDAIGGTPAKFVQLQAFPDENGPNQIWTLKGSPFDNFFLVHSAEADNLVWDVPDGSIRPDKQLQLYPMDPNATSDNQLWSAQLAFTAEFPVVISSGANGDALDVPGFATDDDQKIQHFQINGGLNQLWAMEPQDDGTNVIRSLSSGKVLTVPGDRPQDAGKTVDVEQVSQIQGLPNQRWRLHDAGDGFVKIESASSPGLVLDVKQGDGADQFVQVFPEHHAIFDPANNQKWQLSPVSWTFESVSDAFNVVGSF
jgi:hypothetical protein